MSDRNDPGLAGTSFNGLSDEQAEALALLSEECAEVIQAVGKILRHGTESFNPLDPSSRTNGNQLAVELGDVAASVALCKKYSLLEQYVIDAAEKRKLRNVGRWLHHATTEGLGPG